MEAGIIPLLEVADRQDLYSMAYVRAVIAVAGFNVGRTDLDRNKDDLSIEHRMAEEFVPTYSRLIVQVKCTYAHNINEKDGSIHYPIDVKTYDNLRRNNIEPRILVLVHVPRPDLVPPQPWIEYGDQYTIFRYRAYWVSLMGRGEVPNDTKVVINIPSNNVFDVKAVHHLMEKMVAQGKKQL